MSRPSIAPSPAAPAAPLPDPTHPCVRCGAPVPLDTAMCERCNPLGLSQPATSQVHGTVFLGIILAVVVMAVAGRVALQGVGPFSASVASVSSSAGGLSVTLRVRNDGTNAGSTTCRITDATPGAGPRTAFVLSPNLEPGETATFSAQMTEFGAEARLLDVECESP
jgi:predicted nucleic acid-binding Zn ribbon protein